MAVRARSALTGAIIIMLVLASAGSAYAVSSPRSLAPEVIVKSRPPQTTRDPTALFRFAGPGRFRCRFDGGPRRACASPLRYTALVAGRHTLVIRSGRAAKPVTVAWTVRPAAGGSPQINVQYLGTDPSGVAFYNETSPDDGDTAQILRVLQPTDPAPGVPHNFLYVLPVEPGTGTWYGDGIETLRELNAQNTYNLTIVEPSFPIEPWYANNPINPQFQFERFVVADLVPWVTRNLATTGKEQRWLLGFSKSGLGAQDLILEHPDVFTAAASWDFPANMDTYTSDNGTYVGDGVNFGTDANFQSNYRLTPNFVQGHSGPFLRKDRIWIGGYLAFKTDVADYGALLIAHTTETPQPMLHRWDSGWVPIALSALSQDGAALPAGP
jgi:Putative esterase